MTSAAASGGSSSADKSSTVSFGRSTSSAADKACTVAFGRSTLTGRALVTALIASGAWTVRIADPHPPDPASDPFLAAAISSGRASYRQTDFRDPAQARSAADGAAALFLPDPLSPAPDRHDFHRLYATSIPSVRNVISACRDCGVESLIYSGPADVVSDGVSDISGGDESLPYPDRFGDAVSELRAQAEAMVLSANGVGGLETCALRACNVFGPGDEELVPLIVEGARSGWLKFIIGHGKNICDFTYVENVAHANICAEQALSSKKASVAGETFFITNKEPLVLWEFISNILEGLGYQRPWIRLPFKFVLFVVVLVERAHKRLGLSGASNSHLTSAVVHTLSCTRNFGCSKAQRHIGYLPIVSLQDGITLTVESFSQLAKGSAYSRQRNVTKPSKAEELLGSGTVADILLWRDDKKTFTCVLSLFMLFYWFLLSGRTFVSSTAGLLLTASAALYFQGSLPSSVFGFNVEKLSSSHFEISELCVRNSFLACASIWNSGIHKLKSLAKGDDWSAFFKAAAFLFLIKLLLVVRLPVLIGVGLICLSTVFILYEQYENEVEEAMAFTIAGVHKLKEKLVANLSGLVTTYVQKS